MILIPGFLLPYVFILGGLWELFVENDGNYLTWLFSIAVGFFLLYCKSALKKRNQKFLTNK